MKATQPILLGLWLQPRYARHRFVATYISILLHNNGRYFGNLLEMRLLYQYRSVVKVQALWLQLDFESNKATTCSSYLEGSTVDKQLFCALLRGKGSCSRA